VIFKILSENIELDPAIVAATGIVIPPLGIAVAAPTPTTTAFLIIAAVISPVVDPLASASSVPSIPEAAMEPRME